MNKKHIIATLAGALLAISANGQAVNISTRGHIGWGEEVLIAGFILEQETTVVIRALGPTLQSFGLFDTVPDPIFALYNTDNDLIAFNDDWSNTQADELLAIGMAPADIRESAMIITLPRGHYTVVVAGYANCVGMGIVEVYFPAALNPPTVASKQ